MCALLQGVMRVCIRGFLLTVALLMWHYRRGCRV